MAAIRWGKGPLWQSKIDGSDFYAKAPALEFMADLRRATNARKTRVKRDSLAPLSSELWLKELSLLHERCAGEDHSFDDRAIRKAFHLAELCPQPLRALLVPHISEDELEALLEEGLHQQAAEFATRQHAASVQHGVQHGSGSNRYRAAMQMDSDLRVEFEAASKVLAIIGAWAGFLTETRQSPPGNDS